MIKDFELSKHTLMHFIGRLTELCLSDDVYKVTVKPWSNTRSLEQNALLWATLGDISRQVEWPLNGRMQILKPEDWKDIFTASLSNENRIAQGIDGGFVMLGRSTKAMNKKEFSNLMEVIFSFGANNDVIWSKAIPVEYEEFARIK